MKKLIFAAAMLFASLGATAQIQFANSLPEALKKAKEENKLVMAIASTTWCGPCKSMAKNVYVLPEVGDYFNKNFVSLKYDLDLADPDSIVKNYPISAYPTYIFIDGDGKEVSRMVGGAATGQAFIDRVTKTTAKENSWAAKDARLKNDPSYANEYIKFCSDNYMEAKAITILESVFEKRTDAEKFSKENLDFYVKFIKNCDSKIFNYIVSNPKAAIAVMGKAEYAKYTKNVMNNIVVGTSYIRGFKKENLDKCAAFIKANPSLKTKFAEFVINSGDMMVAKDFTAIYDAAIKNNKKFSTEDRQLVVRFVTNLSREKEFAPKTLALLESCVACEKDAAAKKVYADRIENIKNPKKAPAGSIPAMRMS